MENMARLTPGTQSLENSSIQDLIDLDNLLNNDNYTYDEWFEAMNDEERIRKELIESINEKLTSNKYDGPNDYQAMYWFAKGLKLPTPQQPTRYVDSDDYLFKNIHKFKVQNKLDDFNHKRIHDKFKDTRLKEARELHKRDSLFLDELMEHQKDLSKFNEYHKKHKLADEEHTQFVEKDYKAANKLRFKSYKEFKDYENNKDGQREVINSIIEEITKNPLNWSIDFRKLNHYGKNQLRPELLSLLMEDVAPRINANQKLMIRYLIDNEWHSKPLNDESWTQLINGLQHDNIFDCVLTNEDGTPVFSDQAADLKPAWYFFDALEFKQIIPKKKEYKKNKDGVNRPDTYEGRNGAFFPYWNNSDLDLTRYQILHTNDNFLMNKEFERTPCVVFALCQLLPQELRGNIICRFMKNEQQNGRQIDWLSNEYNNKHLDFCCKEYSIYCKVHYYDEFAVKPSIRTFDRGVSKDKSKYQIELAMYKDHYFIYEKTKYTRYFIQHYEELKNIRDSYKIIGKNKYDKYQRDSRVKYCLNSLELAIEMMKQGLFTQMNFKDLFILRSPLLDSHGKVVDDDTPLNEISNVNFDYNGQMFYDFEDTPEINTEPLVKSYVTFDDGEIDSFDDDDKDNDNENE